MVCELKQSERAAFLFEGWQDTMIWSCLQGVMGRIYVNSENASNASAAPVSAVAWLGDFSFMAGRPDRELALYKPEAGGQNFGIAVPGNEDWAELIEKCYGGRAVAITRYAIKKEPDIFDRLRLRRMTEGLPEGCVLKPLDEKLFYRCREIEWCRDWVSLYEDYALYQKHGLGMVVLKDGEPVSGASSYSGYLGGIEIQIDTREDFRRKGLARICGASLILECLERGWYPSWDAQNKWSVGLAEKLGYHFSHEYRAYEIKYD